MQSFAGDGPIFRVLSVHAAAVSGVAVRSMRGNDPRGDRPHSGREAVARDRNCAQVSVATRALVRTRSLLRLPAGLRETRRSCAARPRRARALARTRTVASTTSVGARQISCARGASSGRQPEKGAAHVYGCPAVTRRYTARRARCAARAGGPQTPAGAGRGGSDVCASPGLVGQRFASSRSMAAITLAA